MADCYLGEIRMFSGTYAPQNWALCNGQLLKIAENEALYSLLGIAYGGDGVSTFAVPDMRGRTPIGFGGTSAYALGQTLGTETVTLTTANLPSHTHAVACQSSAGTTEGPAGTFWANNSTHTTYTSATPNTPLSAAAVASTGSGLPHENMMPFLACTFIISLTGVYPSFN